MGTPYAEFRKTATIASRFMDTVGDGSGSIHMNVAGTLESPVVFKTTAAENEVLLLHREIIGIRDNGGFDSGYYGDRVELDNGIVQYTLLANGNKIYQTSFNQYPIVTNADWACYCHDLTIHDFGAGHSYMTARYTWAKDGAPVILMPGDSIVLEVRDDLSNLKDHTIRLGMTRTILA